MYVLKKKLNNIVFVRYCIVQDNVLIWINLWSALKKLVITYETNIDELPIV